MKTIEPTQNKATINPSAVAAEFERPQYSRREVLLTMSGVLLVMLLASLDQTIVSTAMPRIISDLHGFNLYTWVTTAYMLTSTVMVPIYGKLSDIFGRKSIFLIGVTLFLAGSAACGAAQTMEQLIAFRAFQGLGAAALMPIAIAVVGDLFPPRERGKWQGVTGAVFGLSSILGPAAGGWITENSTWRWVFYVNLPVGIAALLVLIFLMPALYRKNQKVRIDYLGAVLLIAGAVPLLLGFSWAGNEYEWLSPQIIGLLGVAVAFLVIFTVYEAYLARHDKQPIIDPGLFKNDVFSISVLMTMISSAGMFGSIFFLPLFAQGILGISATNSGLILSPMMISLIIASVISGQLVSRFGKYKWIAIVGMLVTIGGSLLLLRLTINSTNTDLVLAMIVFGCGLGFSMSLYTLIVQNAIPDRIGQATSTMTFFRSIGGTIALAAMGTVMTSTYVPAFHDAIPSKLKSTLPAQAITAFENPNVLLSPEAQKAISASFAKFGPQGHEIYNQLMTAVKTGLAQGIHNVFFASLIIVCIGAVVVFFLREIPLLGKQRSQASGQAAEDGAESATPMVMH